MRRRATTEPHTWLVQQGNANDRRTSGAGLSEARGIPRASGRNRAGGDTRPWEEESALEKFGPSGPRVVTRPTHEEVQPDTTEDGPRAAAQSRRKRPAADRSALIDALLEQGYEDLREIDGHGLCGIREFVFTTAVAIQLDEVGYRGRYCYEVDAHARAALRDWDGKADPSGPWIKYKGAPGERTGPGFAGELYGRDFTPMTTGTFSRKNRASPRPGAPLPTSSLLAMNTLSDRVVPGRIEGHIELPRSVLEGAAALASDEYAAGEAEEWSGDLVRIPQTPEWLHDVIARLPLEALAEHGFTPRPRSKWELIATAGVDAHTDDAFGLVAAIVLFNDGLTFRQGRESHRTQPGQWFIFDDRSAHAVTNRRNTTMYVALTVPLSSLEYGAGILNP